MTTWDVQREAATAAIMAEAEKRYAEGTLQEVDTLKDMEGGY